MLESGINNVAAALVARKAGQMGAVVDVDGEGMNHRLTVRKGSRVWRVLNAADWFAAESELRREV